MVEREEAVVTVWEEHRFWLDILRDHALFVRDALSVTEQQWITQAEAYIREFTRLLAQLERVPRVGAAGSPEMVRFAQEAWPAAYGYFQLEGTLQALRIYNQVVLSLTPTYFNGTLNENQEYLRQLRYLMSGAAAVPLPLVSLLDLWLEDQLGHAVLLRNVLDPIESQLIREAETVAQQFQALILQNHHIKGYLRFAPPGMPRQHKLALDTGAAVVRFNELVVRVVRLYADTEVLNRTTLRFLAHHFPETCYFLKHLSRYAPEFAGAAAGCELTKPSFAG